MNSQLRNCNKCRALFIPSKNGENTKLCKNCLDKETDYFKRVKEYLLEFPSAGIKDITYSTSVPEEIIIQFLKEGRIEVTSENCILNCEKCFKPIKYGRYCKDCATQLSKNLTSLYNVKNDESDVASILTKIQLRDKQ